MSRETSSKVKRGLFKSKKRPISTSQICFFGFMSHESCGLQQICPKRPKYKSKETHTQVKRDPHSSQKRPTLPSRICFSGNFSQNSCGPQNVCRKRPPEDKRDPYRPRKHAFWATEKLWSASNMSKETKKRPMCMERKM